MAQLNQQPLSQDFPLPQVAWDGQDSVVGPDSDTGVENILLRPTELWALSSPGKLKVNAVLANALKEFQKVSLESAINELNQTQETTQAKPTLH